MVQLNSWNRPAASLKVFRSRLPITDIKDDRLELLRDVLKWFKDWRKEAALTEGVPLNEHKKSILIVECCDDIEAFNIVCLPRSLPLGL